MVCIPRFYPLTSLSLPLSFHTATQLVRAKNCLGQKLTKAVTSYHSNFLRCKHTEGEVLVSKGATLCTFREHSHSLRHTSQILPPYLQGGVCWGELVTTPEGTTCSKVNRILSHPRDNQTRRGMHQEMEGEGGGKNLWSRMENILL